MTDINDWQEKVGRAWAAMWPQTDRSFTGLTEQFLGTLAALPGHAILDVGCGAGELALALARQRHDARIIGVDVSPELIEAAQARSGERGRVEFRCADAALWQPPADFRPDLIVSRHGVMFFADPVGAFAHLRAISAPGARLAFTCFRAMEENEWAAGLSAMLQHGTTPPPFAAGGPGPFAFADPDLISRILGEAGWSGLRIEPVDFAYIAGLGPNPVDEAAGFFTRIGPAARAMAEAGEIERELLDHRLRHWLERHRKDSLIAFAAAAWRVTARRD